MPSLEGGLIICRGMKVEDNLYAYIWRGRGNNANTYLLADVLLGPRPHVVVDPGYVVNELSLIHI